MTIKPVKIFLTLLSLVIYTSTASAQNQYTFGYVQDSISKETIPNATVYNHSLNIGTISNSYGYYKIKIDTSQINTLTFQCLGYKIKTILTDKPGAANINVRAGIELSEFNVSSQEQTPIKLGKIGQLNFSSQLIDNTTALGGENNLMETLKQMPGVSSGKEGKSEISVRGGSHDQNQILLDGAPVYNLNHAYGLFSVFNSSTIKNASLYKGGIPAKYGGFLSSVLDVNLREGNRQKYQTSYNISTLAAAITTEGPIIKDKMSFMFSARRSWPDLIMTGVALDNAEETINGLSFHDINAKINYTLKKKHHMYLSYYQGGDALFIRTNTSDSEALNKQQWGSKLGSFRYQSISDNGSFNDVLLYYSSYSESNKYTNSSDGSDGYDAYDISTSDGSKFDELGYKITKTVNLVKNTKTLIGQSSSWRNFTFPSESTSSNEISNNISYSERQSQTDIFIDNEVQLDKLEFNIGLRTSIVGYKNNWVTNTEPRFSLKYIPNDKVSYKAGYMINNQYLFAAPKYALGSSGYIWLPYNSNLEKVSSRQVSLGSSFEFFHLNVDIEGYYKQMFNILGTELISTKTLTSSEWANAIPQGNVKGYGIDALIQYKTKRIGGHLKYSFANTKCSYSEVNNGNWFPYAYDIRHDVAIQAQYFFKPKGKFTRWLSSSFIFNTGIPMTVSKQTIPIMPAPLGDPSTVYYSNSVDYFDYPNNTRNKTYHRLDISYHNKKDLKKGNKTWTFGLMNIYNRQNSYWIYKDDGQYKSISLFPIMPAISYKRVF